MSQDTSREQLQVRQANLSAAKRALLERWKRGAGGDASSLPRRPAGEAPPLALAQERLWVLDQLHPGNPAYNQPALVRLHGALDAAVLAGACNALGARHEVLRTAFAATAAGPRQVIHSAAPPPIAWIDLLRCPAESRESTALRAVQAESRRPFDLDRAPLFRVTVVRLAADRHLLLLSLHHIVTDGWSDAILIRELGELYRAGLHGRRSPLPPLPAQYADYAVWQRRQLSGDKLQRLLDHWRAQLDGAPAVLELPTDRPRPPVQRQRGERLALRLGSARHAALRELGRRTGDATPFMGLLATFQLLLARLAGQREVCVGTPVANRSHRDVEGLIGFFVNTVVLRGEPQAPPSFLDLLERVRESTLAAFAHQDLPFAVLVEELAPERHLSHTPLFQVMLSLLAAPPAALTLDDVRLEPLPIDNGTAKLDLTLQLVERDGRLEGFLEYDRDLFDRTTAVRLTWSFVTLLDAALATPEAPPATLPLLAAAERHQLVHEWHDTDAPLPALGVAAQIAETARLVSDAVAVSSATASSEDVLLTYGELRRRSAALGHRLRSQGLGPGQVVGIAAERTPALVTALLGVWEAGAAYLPLDPALPAARLAFMVEDSGARTVLCDPPSASRLPAMAAQTLPFIDGTDSTLTATEPAGPAEPAEPPPLAALAYVLYTSGSTGRPKGVGVSQQALTNFLAAMARRPGLSPADVLVAVTTLSFDIAGLELYLPLLTGARVDVAPSHQSGDGAWLRQRLDRLRASALQGTPATWRLLLAAGWRAPRGFAVLCGGEPLTAELARQLLTGEGEVWNLYGPTETTVWSAAVAVRSAPPVALGRPIGNTRLWLLDRSLQPVPIGVAAELWIGGAGLARGYAGRPALTADRFVPDPFAAGAAKGARLYRTGDLARFRADGLLTFLGRTDHQVKVRGFRIELGEIEAALSRHPRVREVVVTAQADPSGEHRLVAYAAGEAADDELRDFLRRQLPEHMIPGLFVRLAALPRLANGKVDRRSLPAAAPQRSGPRGRPPSTPAEMRLAEFWRDLLQVDEVAADDHFFHLGGHSILATQLLSRVRDGWGVEVPLRRLFEAPTLAALAREIESAAMSDTPALTPVPHTPGDELPLSFAQQRLWVLHQLDPDDVAYTIPAAIRLSGRLQPEDLASALTAIRRRHEALRTTFALAGGQPVQLVSDDAEVAMPLVDLTDVPVPARGREAGRLSTAAARRSFDLDRGPLLRTLLLRLADGGARAEHTLLLSMHHIVSDGWSLGILLRELAAFYEARVTGGRAELSPLAVQYPDFARWQRGWLRGEVLERQLAYWRDQLAGVPPVLELPTDRPRPAVRGSRGGYLRFHLPAPEVAALTELARRHGATLFIALLAALQALLGRLSGQASFNVGTVIANRGRSELEALIGFFVNTLVMRASLTGDPSFAQLVERQREVALGAYAHQDVPFELLVEELEPERDTSRTPLFQVMFALQNAPMPPRRLRGLDLAPTPVHNGTTKFDLNVIFQEGESPNDGLLGWVEHSTDLFDHTTVRRFVEQLCGLSAAAGADPDLPLSALPLLAAPARQQLSCEWNDTAAPRPEPLGLHLPFAEQVRGRPAAVAAVQDHLHLSYETLASRAHQLARQLRELAVPAGGYVGVLLERSPEMLVAVLGILEADAAYLPLETAWPRERQRLILRRLGVTCLVTDASQLRQVHDLRWQLPALRDVICLDVAAPRPPAEPLATETISAFWDHLAESAVDRITAGGFVSSYTGEPFSEAEVDTYLRRVVELATAELPPRARVLEIGCGSGLILFELAPQVGRYVGVDPSPVTQERNRAAAREHGLEHVELRTGFAHDLPSLLTADETFDLVIFASTVQFFPGPFYLEEVLHTVFDHLAPGGAVLLADLLDARRQDDFRESLAAFEMGRRAATEASGDAGEEPAGALSDTVRTRKRFEELYLDEGYFHDLAAELSGAVEVAASYRSAELFANELRFRFDVLLRRRPGAAPVVAEQRRRSWTGWHLAQHLAQHPKSPSARLEVHPEAPAYAIFTSGSTGTPKGVMVSHRPAAQLTEWVRRTFAVDGDDRLLFVTSLCFDLSVYDVFGTLGVGGTVQVAGEEELRDPQRLVELLCQHRITFWDSAPAALAQLTPFLPPAGAPGTGWLRLVFLSGDWIPVALPDRLRASFARARVISLGGATEATVWSNVFPVGSVDPAWPSIPYGRPITNARYLILDRRLAARPIGVPGDLYIGGECLAVGYAEDPAQSADRFLPDPWHERPGARMYRTGDLARFFADGNVEFLGRCDHQVKIRGFRIELGEIQSVLDRHPQVREAVVIDRRDAGFAQGERYLAAYVVAVEPLPAISELRDFLRRHLPEYMVPPAFVFLPNLPVTANGKLDRRALPAPDAGRPDLARQAVAPRTPAEQTLAAVWSRLLGIDPVGVHDNFFDLGGDSILGIQVVSEAREAGLIFAPPDLFRHPTIAELAERATNVAAPAVAPAGPYTGEVLPTPIQRWFLERGLRRPDHFNQAVLLRLKEPLAPAVVARAAAALMRVHDTLRLRCARAGECWQQSFAAPGGPAPFHLVDLSALPPAQRAAAQHRAAAAIQSSLDLAHGPVFRLVLFDRGVADAGRLLWAIHHLAVDGVSWRVLLGDLERACTQLAAGEKVALPASTSPFHLWSQHLAGRAARPELRAEAEHWLDPARHSAPQLPRDHVDAEPRTANTAASARQVVVELDHQATRDLLQKVPAAYRTEINDVLLAALAQAMTEWTGGDALLVDLEGHGRDLRGADELGDRSPADLDLTRTVGWLTALFPVLLDLGAAWEPGEVLTAVKEQLRAVPGRGVGYGLLRYLGPAEVAAELAAVPPATVSFNYLGQLDQTFAGSRLFAPADEPVGPLAAAGDARSHQLEVVGSVIEGRLRLSWTYSEALHRRQTIEALAERFLTSLQELIEHCLSAEAGYTPSEFPEARLGQKDLDKLLARLQSE